MLVISRCNLRDGTSGFAGLQKWQWWGVNGRLAASAALSASRGGLSRRVGAVGYVRRHTRVRRQKRRWPVRSPVGAAKRKPPSHPSGGDGQETMTGDHLADSGDSDGVYRGADGGGYVG